jgi:hypothetical protein
MPPNNNFPYQVSRLRVEVIPNVERLASAVESVSLRA